MSNPIIAKTGEDRYCLVKVPEDAKSLLVYQGNLLTYEHEVQESDTARTGLIGEEELPSPGNWIIVGIGKDLKEDQWKEIVESKRFYDGDGDHSMGMVTYYREYPNDIGESALLSATESGFSYLRSHGADETFLILKEVK